MEQTLLARYYAFAAGADEEDTWINAAITRLERDIEQGDWQQARANWERFAVDIEGHFAFEELVIARTGYAWGREHRRHHDEGLAAVRALLCNVPASEQEREQDTKATLLSALRQFRGHVRAHLEGHDHSLLRHAGRRAGFPVGSSC